jgi:MFS family permease
VFVAVAIAAAFSTYFAMYAFRKPFAAAKFEGEFFLGTAVALKTAIVISQIIGYALSKYIGIKVCSEVTPARRAVMLLGLVGIAQGALVLYGLLPNNWKVLAIFLNGLPLGMIWGLVVWYLEGRRTSELLLAGLSLSYILASGVVKDFGRALMEGTAAGWWANVPLIGESMAGMLGKVSEGWMPAVAGFHFVPVFLVSVWVLNQLPRPSAADVAARAEREPMKGADRMAFVRQFAFGLTLLCVAYFFLTAYRDFRDNYQVEIFDGLGYPYQSNKTIISRAESIVTFGVMGVLALLNLVRDNRRGLLCAFGIMTGGVVLLGASTALLQMGMISGFWWMTLTGLGSYLAYVPYGSVLFERLMASTRVMGTAVFAIYLADAIGYTGSVGVQLYKDLAAGTVSRFGFFTGFTWFMSVLGAVCLLASAVYFARKTKSVTSE